MTKRTEEEQRAIDALAAAARIQANTPVYRVVDENGGHFVNKQQLKQDAIRVGVISLMVIIVGAAICYAGNLGVNALLNDRKETKILTRMLVEASINNETNLFKGLARGKDVAIKLNEHLKAGPPPEVVYERYWTATRIEELDKIRP